METMASGNLLVIQSGSASCASNASLSGIIAEALDHECIGEIYGGLRGFSGILGGHFIDLAAESQQNIRALKTRAGAALGLGPRSPSKAEDFPRILEVLKNHHIRYFFSIGDRSAQEELFRLHSYAQEQAWPLQTMGLPQSIDNDLAVTDHCPGYGSALKYIATTVREVAMDGLSSGLPHLVSVVEVAGRHTGWLAAGASLAKRANHPEDAPHILYLPEVAFSKEQLLNDVQTVLQSLNHCLLVVAEGIVDAEGNSIISKADFPAAMAGAGSLLKAMINAELNVPVRVISLGATQGAAAHWASQTDLTEAFGGGRQAVRWAIEGHSGQMLTLLREEGNSYGVKYDLTDLSNVIQSEKAFPLNWLEEDACHVQPIFSRYALPLIQGNPELRDEEGLPFANYLKQIPVKHPSS
ncbi:MAG: diphosphate--fructose-6-phosphate 1-phosphotransferase [Puniceicoccales bacterium]|jgi:6-phosphofructokinase 1|nr:diphosphate--fructose-6-phosphate 1-phosphotransferase [Puniceicoccales bacterium]